MTERVDSVFSILIFWWCTIISGAFFYGVGYDEGMMLALDITGGSLFGLIAIISAGFSFERLKRIK